MAIRVRFLLWERFDKISQLKAILCAMKHLSAFLARCLLVVLLATVLAPGFAWQMLGGMDQAMLEGKKAASGHHHAAYADHHADHDSDRHAHLAHGDETAWGRIVGRVMVWSAKTATICSTIVVQGRHARSSPFN